MVDLPGVLVARWTTTRMQYLKSGNLTVKRATLVGVRLPSTAGDSCVGVVSDSPKVGGLPRFLLGGFSTRGDP